MILIKLNIFENISFKYNTCNNPKREFLTETIMCLLKKSNGHLQLIKVKKKFEIYCMF